MCACESTPPGSTYRPVASMSSRPGGKAVSMAATRPSAPTARSARRVPSCVTSVPPRTVVANTMADDVPQTSQFSYTVSPTA
eukprot:2623591-Prymnesium_polylepis.1